MSRAEEVLGANMPVEVVTVERLVDWLEGLCDVGGGDDDDIFLIVVWCSLEEREGGATVGTTVGTTVRGKVRCGCYVFALMCLTNMYY